MQVDSMCVMCGEVEETEHHLFFECAFSRVLWYCCSLQLDMGFFGGRDFRDYWRGLCMRFQENNRCEKVLQECVFVLWRIWKSRNDMVFNGVLVNPMDMVHVIRKQILEFRVAQCVERGDPNKREMGQRVTFARQPVRWRRPMFGVLKINCDKAWSGKFGK
ncbi:hypothetical protein ACFX2G_028829 [Malus domestica]